MTQLRAQREIPKLSADVEARREADRMAVSAARLVMIDLDGCLAFGGVPHPAAAAFLAGVADRYVVLSNNSSDTPASLAAVLAVGGLAVDPSRMLLAGTLMIDILARDRPRARVNLVASREMRAHARARGLRLATRGAEVVALARDITLTYAKIAAAVAALHGGAELVVSNPDITHPGVGSVPVPETGALLAMLTACFPNVAPRIVGKPHPLLFEGALARFGVAAGDAVMIGDNSLTDGVGAERSGIRPILVGPGNPHASIADLIV
jgi:HAD superfamily hydrolase (TIGR01450 family)